MQFNWYILILIVSALFSAVMTVAAFRRRSTPGGLEMAGLMFALSIWTAAEAASASFTSLSGKITWTVISYLGSQTAPVWFYLFVHTYTRQERRLQPGGKVALFFIPLISIGIAATNPFHQLLWKDVHLAANPVLGIVAQFRHGPWFWIEIAYVYMLIGTGLIILLQAINRFPYLYQLFHRALLLAVLVPWLLSILYVFVPEVVVNIDLTPIAFTWSGLWLIWAVTRQGFLDYPAVTREDMLERLREGILLFDAHNRLVEANLAARDFFHLTRSPQGQHAADVFRNQPGIHSFLGSRRPARTEITLLRPDSALTQPSQRSARSENNPAKAGAFTTDQTGGDDGAAPLTLQLNLVPLENEAGKRLGSLITAIDVSERRKFEEALKSSELRYRMLVENQGEGIVIVNSDEIFTFANPAAERIFGALPGKLVGRSLLDYIPPDQIQILQEQIARREAGEQGSYELDIQREDGTRRTLEVTARRQDFLQANMRASFALVRDITERKQDERALLQSNTALRARERFLAMLNDITRTALEAGNLESMSQIIADQIGSLYGADGCYITLWNEERRLAIPIAAFGPERDTYPQAVGQPGEMTLTESVLKAGHALVAEDTLNSPYLSPSAVNGSTRSALGLPLIAGGRKLGAVLVGFDGPHEYSAEEVSMGEILAGQLALAVLKTQLVEETTMVNQKLQKALEALDHLATTDKLTGAYNRHKFDELIQYEFKRLDRYRHPVSLILFDVDNFKQINDQFGHHAGDQVLVEIASTVRKNIREVDSLVRWGGDEFLILVPNQHYSQALIIAEKIRAIVAECRIGPVARLSLSIGVTELSPGESPEEPVRRADQALYLSKQNGRNQVEVVLP